MRGWWLRLRGGCDARRQIIYRAPDKKRRWIAWFVAAAVRVKQDLRNLRIEGFFRWGVGSNDGAESWGWGTKRPLEWGRRLGSTIDTHIVIVANYVLLWGYSCCSVLSSKLSWLQSYLHILSCFIPSMIQLVSIPQVPYLSCFFCQHPLSVWITLQMPLVVYTNSINLYACSNFD
jgi:hypothetical protein